MRITKYIFGNFSYFRYVYMSWMFRFLRFGREVTVQGRSTTSGCLYFRHPQQSLCTHYTLSTLSGELWVLTCLIFDTFAGYSPSYSFSENIKNKGPPCVHMSRARCWRKEPFFVWGVGIRACRVCVGATDGGLQNVARAVTRDLPPYCRLDPPSRALNPCILKAHNRILD